MNCSESREFRRLNTVINRLLEVSVSGSASSLCRSRPADGAQTDVGAPELYIYLSTYYVFTPTYTHRHAHTGGFVHTSNCLQLYLASALLHVKGALDSDAGLQARVPEA